MAFPGKTGLINGGVIQGEINFDPPPPQTRSDETASILIARPDNSSNNELQIFGGDWDTDFNTSHANIGVRLGGNYLAFESSDISVRLNDAVPGSRVVVAGLTERGNAILAAEPPPIPDYVALANGFIDTVIYAGGTLPSAWVQVCDTLTINIPISINAASINMEILIENFGTKAGEFEIGVGIGGAEPTPTNSVLYSMGPLVKQIYANNAINANSIPDGTEVIMYARAVSGGNNFAITAKNAERSSLLKVTVITVNSALQDAPNDGNKYVRMNNAWVMIP
jgi:hypothetical protein